MNSNVLCVNALQEDYAFISDSQEVKGILESEFGKKSGKRLQEDFSSLFVLINEGEYQEIRGMAGIIPYNYRLTYKLK